MIVKTVEVHEMTEEESIKVEEGDGWTKSKESYLFAEKNPIRHTVVVFEKYS